MDAEETHPVTLAPAAGWQPTDDAGRARTLLALGGTAAVHLEPDGDLLRLPVIGHLGVPLLLADAERAQQLRAATSLTLVLTDPQAGTVRMTGRPRKPSLGEHTGELARYRHDHLDCGPGCGAQAEAVGVELVRVAAAGPGARTLSAVQVPAYRRGVVADALVAAQEIAHHLNLAHAPELHALAARLLLVPAASLLAVQVSALGPDMMTLSLVDELGASPLEVVYGHPVGCVAELSRELHHLLAG